MIVRALNSNSNFGTIIADPPWAYNNKKGPQSAPQHRPNSWNKPEGMASSSARYNEMSLAELKTLSVSAVMSNNAHLYLWTTNSMMVEAHEVARAWGFEPKTIITWVKVRHSDGLPSMKMGYYYRSATEHVLFATRGTTRLKGPARPTCFFHPRLPHSVKPSTIHRWAEEQSPPDFLELFARRHTKKWVCLGVELGNWPW